MKSEEGEISSRLSNTARARGLEEPQWNNNVSSGLSSQLGEHAPERTHSVDFEHARRAKTYHNRQRCNPQNGTARAVYRPSR